MKFEKFLSVILIALQLIFCTQLMSVVATEVSPEIDQIFQSKEYITSLGEKLNYRIFVPKDYNKDKKYPVLLFMHGYGVRGNDIDSQLIKDIKEAFKVSESPVWNSIVIVPHCPIEEKWVNVFSFQNPEYFTEACPESKANKRVIELLGFIKDNYSTDENRYYVTGVSMGGFATWDLIVRHPNLFAAAVPICGGADNEKAKRLVSMPIWTFHGDMDETVPIYGTQKMVDALKKLGSTKVKFTVFKGEGHYIQNTVYSDIEVFKWLYLQDKALRPVYNIEDEISSASSYQSSVSSVNSPVSSTSVLSSTTISSAPSAASSKTTTTSESTSSKNTAALSQSTISSEHPVSKEGEIISSTESEADTTVSDNDSSKKSESNGIIIVIVCSVVAALVIGVIITLVIIKLKKKHKTGDGSLC